MIGIFILGSLMLFAVGLIWFICSDSPLLDDVLRERADYDIWLRRNSISEEKEKNMERQKDNLDHQTKMHDLKKEVDTLEKLLGKK
jgi:hypothetical protein